MSKADLPYNIICGFLFVFFALVCIFPFYYLFICTISNPRLVEVGQIILYPKGLTLKNYQEVLKVQNLGNATLVTVARTVLGTGLSMFATSYLAYFFTKQEMFARKFWYRAVVATMYFSAGMIPVYLNNKMLGLLNTFWIYILPGMVGVYNMILVKTSMEAMPAELEESAVLDGAKPFQKAIYITIPMLKSTLMANIVLVVSGCFRVFDMVYVITGGGPMDSSQLLSSYMYYKAFRDYNTGYASAIAIVMMIMGLSITGVIKYFTNKISSDD